MKGKYLVLEKLDGSYRADLPIGNKEIQGWCLEEPIVGHQFFLYTSPNDVEIGEAVIPKGDLPCAWTSRVASIDLENQIIKTANSTYRIIIETNEK